jgi:hypothetical protein
LAGLTREEKLSVLREIVEGCGDTNVGAVLKAIEIDNKMQGHNAAEKIETHVTGDLLEVVRREAVVS